MPSVTRLLRLALCAAVLAALVSLTDNVPSAVASPLPMPIWKTRSANLVQRLDLIVRADEDFSYVGNDTQSGLAKHIFADYDAMPNNAPPEKRQDTNINNNMAQMNSYQTKISQNAQTIHGLATSPAGSRGEDFNQQYASAVSDFHANFMGLQTCLDALAADKGLANYNRKSSLETMLKTIIDSTKFILSDTYTMFNDIPGIGPVLGPIVYQIKCIVDELLDATENITDAVLNYLEEDDIIRLLKELDGQAADTACKAGIDIAGICIPL